MSWSSRYQKSFVIVYCSPVGICVVECLWLVFDGFEILHLSNGQPEACTAWILDLCMAVIDVEFVRSNLLDNLFFLGGGGWEVRIEHAKRDNSLLSQMLINLSINGLVVWSVNQLINWSLRFLLMTNNYSLMITCLGIVVVSFYWCSVNNWFVTCFINRNWFFSH